MQILKIQQILINYATDNPSQKLALGLPGVFFLQKETVFAKNQINPAIINMQQKNIDIDIINNQMDDTSGKERLPNIDLAAHTL